MKTINRETPCVHLGFGPGEEFCKIDLGNKNCFGYHHSYRESLCKGCNKKKYPSTRNILKGLIRKKSRLESNGK